jgi:hypothetical protein
MIKVVVQVSAKAGLWHWSAMGMIGRSATPLLDASRRVLAEHPHMANEPIEMWHRGCDHVALQSTVAHAATLAVSDRSPRRIRFEPWQSYPSELRGRQTEPN